MSMKESRSKHQSSDAQFRTSSQSAGKKKSLDQNIAGSDSETNEEADPICEKCGNIMIKEPLDSTSLDRVYPEKSRGAQDRQDRGDKKWVCPHCQGKINFFGDSEE